ncbi:amidase family protein [Pseudonocardia phyllosphaerae]|uniref:hypothetical protein n=1 Tax=Pseudonocardia phyllosphaerae TaxID=3390502 RepID=UPI0039784543
MTSSAASTLPTPAASTAGAVRQGLWTAGEVAERVLTADGAPHATLLRVDPEPLRAAAGALDRRADRFALPLAGVPVAVEDGISVVGRGDEPVRRLRGAGALVAGRTRTAEFGLGSDGSPGGRAAAAVVASGRVALAIGIDGDGALRAAASTLGLAALKPGRRVLPLPAGADRRWAGLAETTLVGTAPDDLTAALAALSVPAPAGRARTPAPAPVAPAEPLGTLACSLRTGRTHRADPDAAAAVHAALQALAAHGLRLLADDPPYRALLGVHTARRHRAGLARNVEDLGLGTAELPRAARSEARRGRRVRRLGGLRPATPGTWRQRVLDRLDEVGADAILLPAPGGPDAAGTTGYAAWNLAGLPSLVTPAVEGCVQLVGRPGSERRLLATGALLGRRPA